MAIHTRGRWEGHVRAGRASRARTVAARVARAFFEALRRGLINSDELEKAASDLEHWIERDRKRFLDEQHK